MPKLGMAIDLERCMGCRACMEACKVENSTGHKMFWMNVFRYEDGEFPDVHINFLPRPCQHCEDAPCVKVCPVQARFKQDDGAVVTDFKRCIGCRYCTVACPYGVNNFNWKDPEDNYYLNWGEADKERTQGQTPPWRNPDLDRNYGSEGKFVAGGGHFASTMEKCTFCVQRVAKGKDPACVENCPVDALIFGDLDDRNSPVSKALRQKQPFRLKDEFNTNPKVYYIGQTPPPEQSRELEPIPTEA